MVKDKVEILRLYENPRTIGCGEFEELAGRVKLTLIDIQFYLLATKNQWFLDPIIMELRYLHWRSAFRSYANLKGLYGRRAPDIKLERSIELATAIQFMQKTKISGNAIKHNEAIIRDGIKLCKEKDYGRWLDRLG